MAQLLVPCGSSATGLGRAPRTRAFASKNTTIPCTSMSWMPMQLAGRLCTAASSQGSATGLWASQALRSSHAASSSGLHASMGRVACLSSSTDTSSVTSQESQGSSSSVQSKGNSRGPAGTGGKPRPGEQASWDLDWFHYTPAWYKPHILIIAAVSFVLGCNLATEPSLKTTIIASAPVTFGLFIFLYVIPRQFKDFAKQYIATHPECEESARIKQREEQEQRDREQQQQH